ncbi:MAG: GNAT family N-acetyltransferase [Cyanobacteria bacterium P01_G01_bin.49]
MVELIKKCGIRQATSQDIWSIRELVLGAFLDPTQLRPEQFWVIELKGKIIACGQLRRFDEAQELGSMVVKRQWRNQGVGTYLTQHLIKQATSPLYLECLGEQRRKFYERFGFVVVNLREISPSLQKKFRLTSTLAKWSRLPLYILILIRVEVDVAIVPLPSETRREIFTSSGYSIYLSLSVEHPTF